MTIQTPLEVPLNGQFRIGKLLATVVAIQNGTAFTLEIEKGMLERYQVTAKGPTEIAPGVTVKAGLGTRTWVCVTVEAPDHMPVGR